MSFWIRRFLLVLTGAVVVIGGGQWLRGRSPEYALQQGLIWGVITAAVFTASRLYQARRGQHCALCRDTPEMQ